ncbi:MAG: molybdopterin-dependent oxidoreductase [Caldisericia bacterium]|jgi:CO/xanthine dehydrogenase Mo-binding subunit|nr:molybdopterin-dependent oxidoreductase [Caldisericia bacterium]
MSKTVKEEIFIEKKVIGKNVEKYDGLPLAVGNPLFTDDIFLPNMLYGKFLLSPYPHAEIVEIDESEALKIPGVKLILSYKNTPRIPHTTAGQGYPEPSPYDHFMFDKKVRYVGDRVCAVCAESIEIAEEAISKIKVTYKELPYVLDPEEAMKGEVIIHDEEETTGIYDKKRNIISHVELNIGDFEKDFSKSYYKIEKEFFITQPVQHTPIETHIAITYFDEYGNLVVRTSTQVPFHIRRILSRILEFPMNKIRVIKPRVGGGFGVKQEMVLEDVCALMTIRTKRPVRIEYTRKEEFIASRLRHPSKIWISLGADKSGKLNAIQMKVLLNNGGYGTHGPTVLFNSGSKTLPLYNKAESVSFIGDAVYTNLPVSGAFRGYGATNGYFALESAMDDLAELIGIDPIELRKINHIKEGETSPVFEKLGEGREGVVQYIESSALSECIDLGKKIIEWERWRGKRVRNGSFVRGVGMAIMMQGSGIPLIDMASARVKLNDDGTFHLFVGATDIGTGSDTVLAQILAEEIGVSYDKVKVYSSDTDFTPFDTGAYASSTTYVSGGAVQKAGKLIKEKILEYAAKILEEYPEDLKIEDDFVISQLTQKRISLREIGEKSFYSFEQEQIEVTASFVSPKSPPPFAAHFVLIDVDLETGKIIPIKYVAINDIGTVVHPNLAKGQVIGSIVQGLGYALTEELIYSNRGVPLNPNFLDYKVLTALDIPEIIVKFIETYEPTGPFGLKSVAEININGPAPAIRNAFLDATGIKLNSLPFTPEKVFKVINKIKIEVKKNLHN